MAMDQMLQEIGDDELIGLDEEIRQDARANKERKAKEGRLFLFAMPKNADDEGKRTATIRFITPYGKAVKLLEHSKFGDYRTICPAEFGFDCPYCRAICKIHKIDRPALLENPGEYQKGTDGITRFTWCWQVWHYEAWDGKGGSYVFAFPVNRNSPVPAIHTLNKQRRNPKHKTETPMSLTQYDVLLTQYKEQQERTFQASNEQSQPCGFDHEDRCKVWTADDIKFGYALAITRDNPDWTAKLQSKRLEAIKNGTATPDGNGGSNSNLPKKGNVQTLSDASLSLDLLDDGDFSV
jgi:hypothetical protein